MPVTAQLEGANLPKPPPPTRCSSKPLVPGQICYVYESIATPIELIFLDTPAIQARSDLSQNCQQELDRIHSPGSRIGKVRPCILMNTAIEGVRSETICLKGTLGGANPASMGKVYKDFVRGVFPNLGLPGSRHIHTVPEGRKENSWVVAYEFETMRPIADTWLRAAQAGGYRGPLRKRRSHRRGERHLDDMNFAILRDECGTSFDGWQQECQDQPEIAIESLEEHRRQRRLRASQSSLNSSMSSLSSCASSTYTVPMDTLEEDSVAACKDGVLQAAHSQDPCGICAMLKLVARKARRKASRFSLRSAKSFCKARDLKAMP